MFLMKRWPNLFNVIYSLPVESQRIFGLLSQQTPNPQVLKCQNPMIKCLNSFQKKKGDSGTGMQHSVEHLPSMYQAYLQHRKKINI
jgi:hypothetical protein